MIKKHPLLFRLIISVFFPIVAVALFIFFHFKSSIAPTMGTFKLGGLNHSVQITHDLYGTPSIVAKTDHDAYFAIGFKHASDRLWQLELQRRLTQGRLSEILGSEALPGDIWMRTLGLQEAAKQSIPYLSKETVEALTAYSDGINAWIAQASNLPPEFQVLGIRPEPWHIYDSISWQKAFALVLGGNMFDEIRRHLLLNQFTPEQMKFFYPYDPVNLPVKSTRPIQSDLITKSDTLLNFGIGHMFAGSNAWVVSGRHTQSGHPIIANDPHVGLQLPALWYAASLKSDRLNLSGMTLVGLPMIIFGQNADIAWGGTNLESDQQDLFQETISPEHPNQYQDGDEWKTFDTRTETINIGANFPSFLNDRLNPVNIVVRKTVRGPVISDTRSTGDEVLSLRWAALDPEDHTIEAFLQLQYATNWDDFRKALSQLKSPGLNFVYADRKNNIGYQAAGMMPKRGEGVGILPLMASKAANWQGYVEFDLMPSIFNPEKGFFVTANEQVDHSQNIVISHEWAPKARNERITTLLKQFIDADKLMTVNDMKIIQGDAKDLTALALLPFFIRVSGETSQANDAISELNKWNGEFNSESVGATLFSTWSFYLRNEIFGGVLHYSWQRPEREALLWSSMERLNWSELAKVLTTNDHGWCKKNQTTPCEIELQRSLNAALKQLEKLNGTKTVSKWNWGEVSRTDFVHRPFGNIKGLESLFKRTTYNVASPNSVNASNNQFDPFKGFTQNFGASFRQVFELDKGNSHWYMVSTGASGNLMSPHFDDMIIPFSNNQLTQFNTNNKPKEIINLIPLAGKQ